MNRSTDRLVSNIAFYLVLVVAFLVRIIYSDLPFCGNDLALFQQFVLDSFPTNEWDSFLNTANYGIGNPLRIFAFLYSIIYPIFLASVALFYNYLGISITEFAWRLPLILISLISIWAICLFLQLFLTRGQSLVTSAFFSIFPLHVAWSRDLSNVMMFSLPLQVFALYFLIKYLRTSLNKYAYISSILISLFILSDNFFPQFLAVVMFTFIVYRQEAFINIRSSLSRINNWRFYAMPISALILQILIFLSIRIVSPSDVGSNAGMLGHILAKPKYFGFHILPLVKSFYDITNPLLFIFIISMSLLGIKSLFRLEKRSILLFAGLIYSVPFIFFMDPTKVNLKVYLFTSIIFLILFSFVQLFQIRLKQRFKIMIILFLFISNFWLLFPQIYRFPISDSNFIDYGTNYGDCGIKTIGYWFRTNTPGYIKVLSFYSTKIGPINGKHYLHREIYSSFNQENIELIFNKYITDVDYVIISPLQTDYLNKLDNLGFNKSYEFIAGDKIILIYSKENITLKRIGLYDYNVLYDQTYTHLADYVGAPNYVADSPSWV
ncbi:MAG: hypothetical protein WC471_05045 [Candidatus Woesearchaeota archaeon]